VAGNQRAVDLRDLLDEFSEIGGDLLAAALALRLLIGFLVTLLLLAVGVGVLSNDPSVRATIVERTAQIVPGLDVPVRSMLRELSTGRATYSALALLGLAWTTGGVYGTLDDALRRVFPGGRPRGLVERRIRGVLAVGIIFGAVAALLILGTAWSAVETRVLPGDVLAWRIANPLASAAVAVLAILVVYRVVPTAPPTLREAGPPALTAGVTVAAMTSAYALIAPHLIGSFSAFGAVAAVIGTLLWLAWVFRVILLCGLWACRRRDVSRPSAADAGER
jgi:uncharacterized BrkB/YihY/UPF0761 family membrane protein